MVALRADILSHQDTTKAEFLDFVLGQYVSQGEPELEPEKLTGLLELKYGSPMDAVRQLGSVADIRQAFRGFRQDLYRRD